MVDSHQGPAGLPEKSETAPWLPPIRELPPLPPLPESLGIWFRGHSGDTAVIIDKIGDLWQSRGMARLARVVIRGLWRHVTQRGNRRQQTLFNDADYALTCADGRLVPQRGRRKKGEKGERGTHAVIDMSTGGDGADTLAGGAGGDELYGWDGRNHRNRYATKSKPAPSSPPKTSDSQGGTSGPTRQSAGCAGS